MSRVEVTLVGDEACGKSALALAFAERHTACEEDSLRDSGDFLAAHENLSAVITCNNEQYTVVLHDTNGAEDAARQRQSALESARVVLVCFSVISHVSFANVSTVWMPEVARAAPRADVLLVGTKADLRENDSIVERLRRRGEEPIAAGEGRKLAKSIGAAAYAECSASTLAHVTELLEQVVGVATGAGGKKKRGKACVLL